ncbi:unnamed protein product [Protopolystoma xenopodis]|uniref:Uncharacterized protein n=1 Tax=Protopolystoma xenopodis TaxID=117903 RepID=A0A448XMV2_9PLAT|nr:unnamed protein product [Protopolystoma xenopodis]
MHTTSRVGLRIRGRDNDRLDPRLVSTLLQHVGRQGVLKLERHISSFPFRFHQPRLIDAQVRVAHREGRLSEGSERGVQVGGRIKRPETASLSCLGFCVKCAMFFRDPASVAVCSLSDAAWFTHPPNQPIWGVGHPTDPTRQVRWHLRDVHTVRLFGYNRKDAGMSESRTGTLIRGVQWGLETWTRIDQQKSNNCKFITTTAQ